jgi:Thiopurine S-methyltransferase (TPMT)
MRPSKDWEALWQNGDTGWDLSGPTPALVEYLNSEPACTEKSVLVPGIHTSSRLRIGI